MAAGSVGTESGLPTRATRLSTDVYDETARALADRVAVIMTRRPKLEGNSWPWDQEVERSIRRLAENVVGLLPEDQQLAFVFEASPAYWRHVLSAVPNPTLSPVAYTSLVLFPDRAVDVPQLRALQAIREAESQGAYQWSPVPEDPTRLWASAREWIEPINNALRRKLPAIADTFLDLCSDESTQTEDVLDWLHFLCDQLAISEGDIGTARAYRGQDVATKELLCSLISTRLELLDSRNLVQRHKSREDRRKLESTESRGVGSFFQKAYYRVRDLVYNPRAQLQRIFASMATDKTHLPMPTTEQAARLAETTVTVMKWHSAEDTGDEVIRVGVAETRSQLAKELHSMRMRRA